jgi:hypothetical protein
MFAVHLNNISLFTKHTVPPLQGLKLFEEIISVYSENHAKLIMHSVGRKQCL